MINRQVSGNRIKTKSDRVKNPVDVAERVQKVHSALTTSIFDAHFQSRDLFEVIQKLITCEKLLQ